MIDRDQLRRAAAPWLGQVLTPEAWAKIEAQALATPDCSIAPGRFPWADGGQGEILRVESFREVAPELKPLHAMHWAETERYRAGLPLCLNYDGMAERERAGRLLQFTVRNQAGALLGHCRIYLFTSQHSGTLVAEEDTLYLTPEARRNVHLAMRLMRYAQRCLADVGVREIRANAKLVNRADVLFRRLGYRAVATQFVLMIEEGGANVR